MNFTVDLANGMPIQRVRELARKSSNLFKFTGASGKNFEAANLKSFFAVLTLFSCTRRFCGASQQ
jgi:hypothetical protein